MRRAVSLALVGLLGLAGPAAAVEETAEGFSRAMQGCWNRTNWDSTSSNPSYFASSQMCLSGGVVGDLRVTECSGGNNLVECSETEGHYQFRDERFWRSYGSDSGLIGGLDSCDVTLGPGKQLALTNCRWETRPQYAGDAEDASYEWATGQ